MTTCEPSLQTDCRQMAFPWMSSAAVSPARISAALAQGPVLLESEAGSGKSMLAWLAKSALLGSSSKTSACFALADWMSCSGRLMRSGMMRSGTVYRLPPLALLTVGIVCGSWPTPAAADAKGVKQYGRGNPSLVTAARTWATPTVCGNHNRKGASPNSGDGLATQVGGQLNPTWVEWLMGCPPGWTDCGPSETPSSRKSSRR